MLYRHVEKLSTTLDEYRSILGKLFPNFSSESLASLPREKLLELITAPSGSHMQTLSHHADSPSTSASLEAHVSPLSNDDDNLEALQTMPEELPDSRNTSPSDLVEGVSDDVNGLSLSARRPSSYLGVSSIQAVIKVIVWLDPGCASYFSRTPVNEQENAVGWLHHGPTTPPQPLIPPSEMQMLDAYFLYFQAFAPMIDERSFREAYCAGRRRDDHWLALLNIVLALGCIAATGPDDVTHQTYFLRCKGHLTLSSLGSSHIETIQALGLMGGWYCHYISQPNLAYSILGAALRMAAALGLHKEFAETRQIPSPTKLASMDLKRRVWWSLFCMDTWAGMTLGRPSMGRMGSNITVKPPLCRDKVGHIPFLEQNDHLTNDAVTGKRSRDSPLSGKYSLRQDRNPSPRVPRRSTASQAPRNGPRRCTAPRVVGQPPLCPERPRALLRVNKHCPHGHALALLQPEDPPVPTNTAQLRHAPRALYRTAIRGAHRDWKMSRSRRGIYSQYRCHGAA